MLPDPHHRIRLPLLQFSFPGGETWCNVRLARAAPGTDVTSHEITGQVMMQKHASLLVFLLLVMGGGIAIGTLTAPGDWYANLAKPSFNPPNWIFGPVWSVLYIMIAIAGWKLWDSNAERNLKTIFLNRSHYV